MLNTPYFKLISNIPDGSSALKEQITRSVSRMNAARHGHSIDRIFQDHDYTFHLPRKTSYMSKRKAKLVKLDSEINSNATSVTSHKENNTVFQTELPDESRSNIKFNIKTKKMTDRANTTGRIMHKRHNTIYNDPGKFREMKEKYTTEMQNLPVENNTIKFIVKENKSVAHEFHNSINNILSYKPTRPTINDEEVRMVSYIDSKPVQPYISLLPLKNFLK
jgi:hypothetical protein